MFSGYSQAVLIIIQKSQIRGKRTQISQNDKTTICLIALSAHQLLHFFSHPATKLEICISKMNLASRKFKMSLPDKKYLQIPNL
jgi:hypothetical protein